MKSYFLRALGALALCLGVGVGAWADVVNPQYLPPGTGALARTQDSVNKERLSVFDYLPAAQVAFIKANNTASQNMATVTAGVQAAIDYAESVGGAVVYFPHGTYRVSTLTWKQQVSAQGDGHYSTIIYGDDVRSTLVLFQNISRVSIRDMQFFGNNKTDNVFKFVAGIASSTGSMLFEHLDLHGALVNTVIFVGTGGSPNDISHLIFLHCYLRSDPVVALVAQITQNAANGLLIDFIGGILSTRGHPSHYNVAMNTGTVTFWDTYFSGARDADIYSDGGTVRVYNGRSESTGAFLHTTARDTSGYEQAPHIIEGFQSSNGGQFVTHEATRVLMINGTQSSGAIYSGRAGIIERGTHTYSPSSVVDLTGAGGIIRDMGGKDRIQRGVTASIASNTPTTIFSASRIGVYNVLAYRAGGGASYMAQATVISEGSALRIVASNGGGVNLSVAGTDVKVEQTSGSRNTVTWAYLREVF